VGSCWCGHCNISNQAASTKYWSNFLCRLECQKLLATFILPYDLFALSCGQQGEEQRKEGKGSQVEGTMSSLGCLLHLQLNARATICNDFVAPFAFAPFSRFPVCLFFCQFKVLRRVSLRFRFSHFSSYVFFCPSRVFQIESQLWHDFSSLSIVVIN